MLKQITRITAGLLLSAAALAAPTLEMKTSQGTIVIDLDSEKAPKTVQNFLQYAKDGFYNGTVFHRVMDGFMIQGGGFSAEMAEKPTLAPVENEARNGLKNLRGTIAMARRQDPHSATAQFFINHKDNASRDYPSPDGWGYAVFGHVVKGFDVIDRIAKVKTGSSRGFQDVPKEDVVIEKAEII